jgi:hypothetical protein
MRQISATIQISAPPARVWEVLTDLARYPQWNPLFREASGQVAAGARLTLKSVHPANGRLMTVRPKVLVAEPARELRWRASLPGVMTGEHSFTLSPADSGTRLVQTETFRGLLVPLSSTTISRTQPQFEALNQALKQRAEGPGQDSTPG